MKPIIKHLPATRTKFIMVQKMSDNEIEMIHFSGSVYTPEQLKDRYSVGVWRVKHKKQ